MPVKIKHKQLGKIETVAYVNWDKHYNHQLWDVLEMWDVGKIYNVQLKEPRYQSTVDKSDFLEAMADSTNQNALIFEPLSNYSNETMGINNSLITEISKAQEQVNLYINSDNFKRKVDYDKNSEGEYLERNELLKYPKHNNIPESKKHPIIIRIKKISLGEWAAIWTIIGGVIALWIYVIQPMLK